jgi:putative FmdB family regulatory protein
MPPVYEYCCPNAACATEFEVSKSVKDYDREETCPVCGSAKADRIFKSTNPVHFKGNGWHNKTYGGKNSSN